MTEDVVKSVVRLSASYKYGRGDDIKKLVVKAYSAEDGAPLVGALEFFLQKIGNVRIYQKVIKYTRK